MKTTNTLLGTLIGVIFLSISELGFSQNIGINTTGVAANASSMLDVVSTTKGMLIPRVALTLTTTGAPVAPAPGAAENGLLVFNTNTAGDVTPGFYYWDGTNSRWVRMFSQGTSVDAHCFTCDGF